MPKPILITGFVPGYPNPQLTLEIAKTCQQAGADILELSASFSEPVADGPTLQLAHQRVLASGFTKKQAFDLYHQFSRESASPLFLIEYANIIYHLGFDCYYRTAAASGINYVAVPDVPIEEATPFVASAKKHGLAQIFLIAPTTLSVVNGTLSVPTTPDERVKKIVQLALQTTTRTNKLIKTPLPTFLYLVSTTGTTGSRGQLASDTLSFIKRVRKLTELPLIVGFGISKKEHIKKIISAGASGAVTCSKIVDIVHRNQKNPTDMLKTIGNYVQSLKISSLAP